MAAPSSTFTLTSTWYNQGGLTTRFVAPPACSTANFYVPALNSGQSIFANDTVSASCKPETPFGTSLYPYFYWSPGVCPSGWTSAADVASSFRAGISSTYQIWSYTDPFVPTLVPSESMAAYCPRLVVSRTAGTAPLVWPQLLP